MTKKQDQFPTLRETKVLSAYQNGARHIETLVDKTGESRGFIRRTIQKFIPNQ